MLSGNFPCEGSGNNIKPKPTCLRFSDDNSIRISGLTLSVPIVAGGTHITITFDEIDIPNHPDNY